MKETAQEKRVGECVCNCGVRILIFLLFLKKIGDRYIDKDMEKEYEKMGKENGSGNS